MVDLSPTTTPRIIDSLYLDDAGPRGIAPADRAAALHDRPRRRRRALRDARRGTLELPRIDYGRRNTRAVLATPTSPAQTPSWIDQLVKVDVRDGTQVGLVGAGAATRASRLRARARAGGGGRGRGAVGGARREAGRSFLLVLDAGSSRSSLAPRRRTTSRSASTASSSDDELRASDADRERWRAPAHRRGRAGSAGGAQERLEQRSPRARRGAGAAHGRPAAAARQRPRDRAPADLRGGDDALADLGAHRAGYFWPIWPMLAGGSQCSRTPVRCRPCRRRSSNPGSSTGRWPSSAAAGPGSGEPRRWSWRRSARGWWSAGGARSRSRRRRRGRGRADRGARLRHPRGGPGGGARGGRLRAPRPYRPAREQRRRPVPHARRGHHAEGLSNGDPAERRGHLADDPHGRHEGDDPGRERRQDRERHAVASPRPARHGALVGGAGRRGEPHPRAVDRVGALRDQADRGRARPDGHGDDA